MACVAAHPTKYSAERMRNDGGDLAALRSRFEQNGTACEWERELRSIDMDGSTPITPRQDTMLSTDDMHRLFEEKRWEELACQVMQAGETDADALLERDSDTVTELLRQIDEGGTPVEVFSSVTSLARHYVIEHRCSMLSLSRPLTDEAENDIAVVGSFLSSSIWTDRTKQAVLWLFKFQILRNTKGNRSFKQEIFDLLREFCWGEQEDRRELNTVMDSSQDEMNEAKIELSSNFSTPVEKSPGDTAAAHISGAARWIERGLKSSIPPLTDGIDAAGNFVKERIQPEEEPLIDHSTGIVTLAYTNATKRATGAVRKTVRGAAFGIRDASTHGINTLARKFDDEDLGTKLVPDKGKRDAVVAVGKVGLATIGGIAVVSEAIFETTKAVAQKTCAVTADVTRHKYGDVAGQIIEDCGESTGNILRAATHIGTMVEGVALTKSVARNTGKIQVKRLPFDGETHLQSSASASCKTENGAVLFGKSTSMPDLRKKDSFR